MITVNIDVAITLTQHRTEDSYNNWCCEHVELLLHTAAVSVVVFAVTAVALPRQQQQQYWRRELCKDEN